MKVRVYVKLEFEVPYLIEVESLDKEKIKEALEEIDPSDWERDPCLYERYNSAFKGAVYDGDFEVEELDPEELELLEEV